MNEKKEKIEFVIDIDSNIDKAFKIIKEEIVNHKGYLELKK